MAITTGLAAKCGFSFSAGLIDYVLNFNISSKPLLLIVIGACFAVIYFLICHKEV